MSALDDYRSGTIIEFSDTIIETIPDEAIAASQAAARSAEKQRQQSSSSDTANGNITTETNSTIEGQYVVGYIKFNLDSTIQPQEKKIRIRISMINSTPQTTTQNLIFILQGKSSTDQKELNKTYSIPGYTDDALSKTLTFSIPSTWENTSKLTLTVKKPVSALSQQITFKVKKITLKDS